MVWWEDIYRREERSWDLEDHMVWFKSLSFSGESRIGFLIISILLFSWGHYEIVLLWSVMRRVLDDEKST